MNIPDSRTQSKVKIAKPFNDDAVEKNVISILRSGMLVQGATVKEFETRLAQYIGCKHVVAVNSGTASLHLAIMSVSESKGSPANPQVITTPLSFAATANAVIHAGSTPVFADVDLETFNIDPANIESKINQSTIAIEPVDVYGLPADLDRIGRMADSHGLRVVEDAAEAIGASQGGKKIGNISDLSCFSTYATKNLHTAEGGFITTNDDATADYLRMARNQGQSVRYNQKILGYNFRMMEFCASIGLEQIEILDELNARRRTNAKMLTDELEHIGCLGFQRVVNPTEHSWYMFALTLDERRAGLSRDNLVAELRDAGVEADVAWPTPIHLQPYFKERYGFKVGDFPNAEKICKSVFQLPIQPFLTQEEVARVAAAVKEALGK